MDCDDGEQRRLGDRVELVRLRLHSNQLPIHLLTTSGYTSS